MSLLDSLARPRTLGVLLAGSLALNLFLAGGIAGRLSAGHRDLPLPPPLLGLGGPGLESGFRFIPEEGRRHVREALHERRPQLREEHKTLRRLHKQIARDLAQEKPDRARIEAAFAEIRQQSLRIEESLQAAFLDAALAMDPAARKSMLDEMLAQRGRPLRHAPPPGRAPMPFPDAPPAPDAPEGAPMPPPPGPDEAPPPAE